MHLNPVISQMVGGSEKVLIVRNKMRTWPLGPNVKLIVQLDFRTEGINEACQEDKST